MGKTFSKKLAISAPGPARSTASTSSIAEPSLLPKVTACGLPIETQVTSHVSPPDATSPATTASTSAPRARAALPVEARVVGTRPGESVGGPMSTRIRPSVRTSGRMIPAPVATAAVEVEAEGLEAELPLFPLFFLSSTSATNRARHRIPLPHISGSDPSLL